MEPKARSLRAHPIRTEAEATSPGCVFTRACVFPVVEAGYCAAHLRLMVEAVASRQLCRSATALAIDRAVKEAAA